MTMSKNEAKWLAAGAITKNPTRRAAVAAQYDTWLSAQDTLATAIESLMAVMHSSRNPNFVLEKAAVQYAATEADAPNVVSISPTSGTTAGGTAVTITGTDFTGATAVTIGGTTVGSLVVVSDTSITGTTPAKTAGAKDVVVTTPAGTDTLVGGFTYA